MHAGLFRMVVWSMYNRMLSSCYLFMHALIYKGLIQLEELYHFLLNYFMLLYSFELVRLNFTLINLACSHNDSWPLTSGSMWNHVYRACIFHWWGFFRDRGKTKVEGTVWLNSLFSCYLMSVIQRCCAFWQFPKIN
jgi:hypothetical protein